MSLTAGGVCGQLPALRYCNGGIKFNTIILTAPVQVPCGSHEFEEK